MTMRTKVTKEENERQYALIDQLLTMHSSLRDRMERRAFWLNSILVALSVFLTALGFVGDDALLAFKLTPATVRFELGLVAVGVLICSITEFRVNWSSVAGKHSDAIPRLAALKAKFRTAFVDFGGVDAKINARLSAEFHKAMANLPPIPERWFNHLRSEHLHKRLLSERIRLCPKAPLWYLRLLLRWEGILDARRVSKDRTNATENSAVGKGQSS